MPKNNAPKAGVSGFLMPIMPSSEALNKAIDQDGFCEPKKCWHFVAISAKAEEWAPGELHHVRVDAGHVKMNYMGWRYVADTPRHVKRSLMLFDLKRYDEVRVRQYNLRFRRTTKIEKSSPEKKQKINAWRAERIARGSDERKRKYTSLRSRIEGFSGIV